MTQLLIGIGIGIGLVVGLVVGWAAARIRWSRRLRCEVTRQLGHFAKQAAMVDAASYLRGVADGCRQQR